jgi:hypothetical protein
VSPSLDDLARTSPFLGFMSSRDEVQHTPELVRVLALPRRDWETDPITLQLVEALTHLLKTPEGTETWRPAQAVAMMDAYDMSGCAGALKMGEGKTHLSYALPVLLDAQRPLLLTRGSLVEDTHTKFDVLAQHWRRHPNYPVVSYEFLSQEKNADFLERMQPDVIVADEGACLKNRGAARTKRVERYLKNAKALRAFVVLTGTMFEKKSVTEYHHLLRWAIGPRAMPLPASTEEAEIWGRCFDLDVEMNERVEPGALAVWGNDLTEIAKNYGEHLRRTPGCVITTQPGVAASLEIHVDKDLCEVPQVCRQAIADVYKGYRPDGVEIDPDNVGGYLTQLSLGFWYRWNPAAPQEWLDARRRWLYITRLVLQAGKYDTEKQLETAIEAGIFGHVEEYETWKAIKPSFRINREAVWLSHEVMDAVHAATKDEPTLIWTSFEAPGRLFADHYGMRFFHAGGYDAQGLFIEACPESTVVASVSANATGRNLQFTWSRNFVVVPPASLELMEQLIARTHRDGQRADTVYVRLLAHTEATRRKIEHLRVKAAHQQGISGPQKLCLADWT